jgi:hypothetical protein
MKFTSVAALLAPAIAFGTAGVAADSGFSKGCKANENKIEEPFEGDGGVWLRAGCGPGANGNYGNTVLGLSACIAFRNDTLQAVQGWVSLAHRSSLQPSTNPLLHL